MKEEQSKQKKQRHKKLHPLIGAVLFSIFFFLLLIAKQLAFLYSHDDLHTALLILQWIIAACCIYYFVKEILWVSDRPLLSISSILQLIVIIIVFGINLSVWYDLRSDGIKNSGYFPVSKYSKNNSCYIFIHNQGESITIPVDRETYNNLVVKQGVQYHISYRTSCLSEVGILEHPIDTNDVVGLPDKKP